MDDKGEIKEKLNRLHWAVEGNDGISGMMTTEIQGYLVDILIWARAYEALKWTPGEPDWEADVY